MNTDQERVEGRFSGKHGEITDLMLQVFYEVYNELGGGFLESVYHAALAMALKQAGLSVVSQAAVPVYFRGTVVGEFQADLIVNESVLLELKALQASERVHEAQVLSLLKSHRIGGGTAAELWT